MIQYLFYFLSFVAVLCALMVILSRNPIYSVLYLILTFFAIGGHYILLNSQFLFAVHIIVYAGAIMVLFLFVIMLLNLNKESEPHKSTLIKFAGIISGCLLLLIFIGIIKKINIDSQALNMDSIHSNQIGLVKNLGKVLFKDFLIPFELSTILFLSAIIGAIMLGKKEIK